MIICVQEEPLERVPEISNVIFIDITKLDQSDPHQKEYYDAIQQGLLGWQGGAITVSFETSYTCGDNHIDHALVLLPVLVEDYVIIYYGNK